MSSGIIMKLYVFCIMEAQGVAYLFPSPQAVTQFYHKRDFGPDLNLL